MKRMVTATTMLVVLAVLGTVALPAARAEDEPQGGDSAAEQAFRDAWWAETSAGALDRALDGYRKAVDAEGPTPVRAKALYRMAVVLERIGKTDDAIRALERLAKDFPDEADLQAKARDRLEAWTAVDLRTNFGEWYERYKYSPEFQGRIVELVLKLGTPGDEANAAAQQLLIVGQAAVPALQEHLDSSNKELRGRAVDLLLELGEFPPVRHLVETTRWQRNAEGWGRVLQAPEAVRKRMLEELAVLPDEGEPAELMKALLEGPSGWASGVRIRPTGYLIRAVLAADPPDAVLVDLWNLVPTLEASVAGMVANLLLYGDVVPDHVALSWLQVPGARDMVARRIQEGSLHDPGTWRAVVDAMNALPVDAREQLALFRAFLRALSDAPPSADLTPAVLAYERIAPSGNAQLRTSSMSTVGTSSVPEDVTAVSHFLVQIVDRARDPKLAEDALNTWAYLHRGDADVSRRLVGWAQVETSPEVTGRAAKYAGDLATDETLDALLDALGSRSADLDEQFLSGLRGNRRLSSLPWTDERILLLHDLARAVDGSAPTRELGRLFNALHTVPDRVDQLTRLALQHPTRVWRGVTGNLDKSTAVLLEQPGRLAAMRTGFGEAWPRWSLEDRLAALYFFGALPGSVLQDEALATYLRKQLPEQWAVKGDAEREALERQVKLAVLEVLPAVTLDDVRAVFDLEHPEEAAAAAGLPRLEKDAESYDALAAARRAKDPATRWKYWSQWAFKGPTELRRRVACDLAKDPWPDYRANGLRDLGLFRNRDDIPLLVEALGDPDADVRGVAAEVLAKVYDRAAIQALVKALDDPAPAVRDQVLETLESIKQIEEKKAYWKELLIEED